jgi:hypothetical protein
MNSTTADPVFDSVRNQRRAALQQSKNVFGIDWVEITAANEATLVIHLIGTPPPKALETYFTPNNIHLQPIGLPSPQISVREVKLLKAETGQTDGVQITVRFSTDRVAWNNSRGYRLSLRQTDPAVLDPFFTSVRFKFNSLREIDYQLQPLPASKASVSPTSIDYLSKDYASFRQLMLDKLALFAPEWQERNPSDLGVMLVELLAYAADSLSYYQDAVATEAYLRTARRRVSVRRHARLLNYPMHDGCNARAWVQIRVNGAVTIEAGTKLLTGLRESETRISPSLFEQMQNQLLANQIFETMHSATLSQQFNDLLIYAWGVQEYWLEKGATSLYLLGDFSPPEPAAGSSQNGLFLKQGDVLMIEAVRDPLTGNNQEPTHLTRHAVRLKRNPKKFIDPLTNAILTQIEWYEEDALPRRFDVAIRTANGQHYLDASLVHGNLLLADAGLTIAGEQLPAITQERYYPRLRYRNLTFAEPYHHQVALETPASLTLQQDYLQAQPVIELNSRLPYTLAQPLSNSQPQQRWYRRPDLLQSHHLRRDFMVETESDGGISLRFGSHGYGLRPPVGTQFVATYRIGNGVAGNVGLGGIAHIVTDPEKISGMNSITGVINLLPAQGGVQPESIQSAQMNAPQAYRTQNRCVTLADYEDFVSGLPAVIQARATYRWTGSRQAVIIYVEYQDNPPVTKFRQRLLEKLTPVKMMGAEVHIETPRFMPLRIQVQVFTQVGYRPDQIHNALIQAFGVGRLTDGRAAFFAPGQFTFGQPLYQGQVVAAVYDVRGVQSAQIVTFEKVSSNSLKVPVPADVPHRADAVGERLRTLSERYTNPERRSPPTHLQPSPLEIIEVQNDPQHPERGLIQFTVRPGAGS